tara:strand:+ start:347 stop:493 length:147 start_codon:yes stop_codon:yes gene_type:complete
MGFDHIKSWYELEEINEQQERVIANYENRIKKLEEELKILKEKKDAIS